MWWLLGLGVVLCLVWTAYNIATAGGGDLDNDFMRREAEEARAGLAYRPDPGDGDPDRDHHAMHYTDD